MSHYAINYKNVEHALAKRINADEACIKALEAVTINTSHKQLTNRAVEGGRIGDYIGIDKALYVSYSADGRYMTEQITAYSYTDENGAEIGSDGGLRISRTLAPTEMRVVLDGVIANRKASLEAIKKDFVNAKKIVAKYNKLMAQVEELKDGTSWAMRGELK